MDKPCDVSGGAQITHPHDITKGIMVRRIRNTGVTYEVKVRPARVVPAIIDPETCPDNAFSGSS